MILFSRDGVKGLHCHMGVALVHHFGQRFGRGKNTLTLPGQFMPDDVGSIGPDDINAGKRLFHFCLNVLKRDPCRGLTGTKRHQQNAFFHLPCFFVGICICGTQNHGQNNCCGNQLSHTTFSLLSWMLNMARGKPPSTCTALKTKNGRNVFAETFLPPYSRGGDPAHRTAKKTKQPFKPFMTRRAAPSFLGPVIFMSASAVPRT